MLFIQLPFGLADSLATRKPVTLNTPADRNPGFAPVQLRFHRVADPRSSADLRALNVARRGLLPLTRAQTLTVAGRLERHLRGRTARARSRRVSVVELTAPIPTTWIGALTPAVSQALSEHCVQVLNRFLDIYQVLTEDWTVHHLSPENIDPATITEFRTTRDKPTGHFHLPYYRSRLPTEVPHAGEHMLGLLDSKLRRELPAPGQDPHPMNLVRRLFAKASRYAELGEYETAIVTLQTSAERLIFALHQLALVDRGHPSTAMSKHLPTSFARALKTLPPILGGNWSLTGNGAVATYWKDLYEVRNSITHVGAVPDRDAVPDAFEAYDGLYRHTLARTLAVRARMPLMALALHGAAGLEQAGGLDQRMRDFLDQVKDAGEQHTFWMPYDRRTGPTD